MLLLLTATELAADLFCSASERTIPPEKGKTGLIAGIAIAAGILSLIVISAVFYIKRKGSDMNEDIGTK